MNLRHFNEIMLAYFQIDNIIYQINNNVIPVGIVNRICSIRQFRTAYDVPPSIPKPIAQFTSHVTPANVRNLGGTYSCNSVYVHPCKPCY